MSLYPRETAGKRVHVVQKGTRGRGGKLACRSNAETRDRVELGRGVGHARGPKHIERIHHSSISQGRRRPTRSASHPRRPIPSSPPFHLSALVSMSFPAARHILTLRTLSRALSPYQIESLYFASSIISFINLRAFRTL